MFADLVSGLQTGLLITGQALVIVVVVPALVVLACEAIVGVKRLDNALKSAFDL